MQLREDKVKRLIIYFFYDRDGIVDDYILYMLKDLMKNCSDLCFVANGKLTRESRQKVSEYTDTIIARENKGFDVWAYKEGLTYYGWDKLSEYDELVMMNFTIMGPVYPMHEMFSKMDEKDLDFWGITKFHEYTEGDPFGNIECGYIPTHIQSHFIAVRSSMLNSYEFHYYWDNMSEIKSYQDAVGKHEAIFTKYFEDKGYAWDVYADAGETYSNNPVIFASRKMVEEKRCPIFKRRSFMQPYDTVLHDTTGEVTLELMDFLKNETDYPVDLIYQNILRLENQADIKNNAQLNYILSSTNGDDISDILSKKKIALVIHFYYPDLAEYCLHYAESMPKEADIYITTDSDEKQAIIEKVFSALPNKVTILRSENRGRDIGPFLIEMKDIIGQYDYVCRIHDKKTKQVMPESAGASFSYHCFENVLCTKEYVENIIRTFDNHPRLGMLTPPPPSHGDYYFTLGYSWGLNFDVTKKLAEKLGLTVSMTEEKDPVASLGTLFWFRPKAMMRLFNAGWKYEDFPEEPIKDDGTLVHAIERIFNFVVQQEGYYPAWVLSDKGAAIELTNLSYMLGRINKEIIVDGPGIKDFIGTMQNLRECFGTWNQLKPQAGNNDNIMFSKIYLRNGDEPFNEGKMVPAMNSHKDKSEFIFEALPGFGEITEVRFDPGEACATTIKDISFEISLATGETLNLSVDDIEHDGYYYQGRIIYLANDPKVFIKFERPSVIRKIKVTGNIVPYISRSDGEMMRDRLNQQDAELEKSVKHSFLKH